MLFPNKTKNDILKCCVIFTLTVGVKCCVTAVKSHPDFHLSVVLFCSGPSGSMTPIHLVSVLRIEYLYQIMWYKFEGSSKNTLCQVRTFNATKQQQATKHNVRDVAGNDVIWHWTSRKQTW